MKRKVKKPKKIKLNGEIIKIEEAEMDEKSREERGRNISLKVAVGMTCPSPLRKWLKKTRGSDI